MLSDVLGKNPDTLVLDYVLDIHGEGFTGDEISETVRIRKAQASSILLRLEEFGLLVREKNMTEEAPRFHENPESRLFQSLLKLDIIALETSINRKKGIAYPNSSEYGKRGGKPKQREYIEQQTKKAEGGSEDGQKKNKIPD